MNIPLKNIKKHLIDSGVEFELDGIRNNIFVNISLQNIQCKNQKIILVSNKSCKVENINGREITNIMFMTDRISNYQWSFIMDTKSIYSNNNIIKFDLIDEYGNNIIANITATVFY